MHRFKLTFIILLGLLFLTACSDKNNINTPSPEPTALIPDSGLVVSLESAGIIRDYASQLINDPANNPSDYSLGGFVWDTENKSDSWRYFNAVMLDAFATVSGEEGLSYVKSFLSDNLEDDGSPKNYHETELDSVPMGLSLFCLLDSDEASRFKACIQYIYSQLEAQPAFENCGGNYLHKASWQDYHIGLDGIYMAQPFLMRCAKAISEGKLELTDKNQNPVSADSLYTEIFTRLHWVAETMYNPSTGLYHHGWNAYKSEGNGHFWARGIGWYAVALADITADMPEGDMKTQLIKDLQKLFDGMLKYQDETTGLWYNVVNAPSLRNNLLESSGSAMMAYSLLLAYNKGLLPAEYGEAGFKAFEGIMANKVKIDQNGKISITDIYQKSGVCTNDKDYTKNKYVADEAKGTALLIMAAKQAEIYYSNK